MKVLTKSNNILRACSPCDPSKARGNKAPFYLGHFSLPVLWWMIIIIIN